MDSNKLAENLKCPVCLEIPENEIYQCKNGHTICARCCVNLKNCPECRVSYGVEKIRIRALERILDGMQFECFYKNQGCTKLSKRKELDNHIKSCSHGGPYVNLCKQIGFGCNFNFKVKSLPESIKHLQEAHDIMICEEQSSRFRLNNFVNATNKTRWTPLLVKIYKKQWGWGSSTVMVLVLSMIDKQKNSVSWGCLFLGESSKEDEQFQLELRVQSQLQQMPELRWKIPTVSYLLAGDIFGLAPNTSPTLSWLLSHYLFNGDLLVDFAITRVDGSGFTELVCSNKEPHWLFRMPVDENTGESLVVLAPSLEETVETQKSDVVFDGIKCYICKRTPIPDKYYASLNFFPEIYLCSPCMDRNLRELQTFALIDNLWKKSFIGHMFRNKRWREILCSSCYVLQNTFPGKPKRSTYSAGVACNTCGQTSAKLVRYKCLQCRKYNICGNCFAHENHPNHIFVVVRNSHDSALIEMMEHHSSPIYREYYAER